jgi:tRNA 5-methylaminomethyl-2-thiouridine biosynthesis bifunctional protein
MKTQPVRPAAIDWREGAPFAPAFGDVYHPQAGALAQAEHVFLRGNQLPQRWQRRKRFSILETGFGLGNNFLATWAAWRADPLRPARLHYVAVELHPPSRADLTRAHEGSALPVLAARLIEQWPPLVANVHRLAFDGGRVELLLHFADVGWALRETAGCIDAFYLDGFAPARNPAMWQPQLFKALARLGSPQATAATWSVARDVREGLARAGFAVERAEGFAGKREMTVARHAPRVAAAAPPGRAWREPAAYDAIVIGAGLAGCAAAAALDDAGLACTLIDRHPKPAAETSRQRAGIFHGVVHADDGPHARFGRASALLAGKEIAHLIATRAVAGSASGLLRLADVPFQRLQATAEALRLPPEFVAAVDVAQACELAGVPVNRAAWHFPNGGWAQAASLCAAWIDRPSLRWRGATVVSALQRCGEGWEVLDADGRVIERAPIVVLAGAVEGLALWPHARWPVQRVHGQTSWLPAGTPHVPRPRLPLAGDGYAVPLDDGSLLFGATSHAADNDDPFDPDAAQQAAAHAVNLARLARLTGLTAPTLPTCEARAGTRLVTIDRLPLVGSVPALQTASAPVARRADQPRFIQREPGLFMLAALGSRGVTWAPLAARLLAAQIAGSPWPLEASLCDAVDPARFLAREARGAGKR